MTLVKKTSRPKDDNFRLIDGPQDVDDGRASRAQPDLPDSLPCSEMESSPLIPSPAAVSATRDTASVVTGRTLPRMARRVLHLFDRPAEVAELLRNGQKHEVPEAVPRKGSPVEAEIKKTPQGAVVFRQGDNAVSYISRRKDSPFFPESPGTSAFVGDGDDSDDIPGEALESAQEG